MRELRTALSLSAGLLVLLSTPMLDAASTYIEPGEKIQDFIDMSQDGDVLIVRDGTFTGDGNRELHFDGKNITLTSEHGPETTIIDCEVQGRAFVLDMGVTQSALIEGLTIRNGVGDVSSGAAFHLANGSSPTIENCVIENSLGTSIYADGSMYPCSPVIKDCEIRDTEMGSGIKVEYGDPQIIRCTITGSRPGENPGGGIYVSYGSPIISGCAVSDCYAYYGSGIYSAWASVDITECLFLNNNLSYGDSGTLHFDNSYGKVSGCLISDSFNGVYCVESSPTIGFCVIQNSVTGVQCMQGSHPKIHNSWVTRNGSGGMVIDGGSDPSIQGCWITDNDALGQYDTDGCGAGIRIANSSSPHISDCWIANNTAYWSGSGIYIHESHPAIQRCTISGNSTISTSPGNIVAGGGIFVNNSPTSGPDMTLIKDSIISGNHSEGFGGGVYIYSTDHYHEGFENCWISGNYAADEGGGAWMGDQFIFQCVLSGNISQTGGGGGLHTSATAYYANGKPVASCLISGNFTGSYGGGVRYRPWYPGFDLPGRIANCTIADNQCLGFGSGVYVDQHFFGTVLNSILWGNTNEQIRAFETAGTWGWNNCVQGGWPYSGWDNISSDPQFLGGPSGTWTQGPTHETGSWAVTFTDNAAEWEENEFVGRLLQPNTDEVIQLPIAANTQNTITIYGDYRMLSDIVWADAGDEYQIHDYGLDTGSPSPGELAALTASPCVDAGRNDIEGLTDLDAYRNHRIWNGGSGWIVDMGALEAMSKPFDIISIEHVPRDSMRITWNSTDERGVTYSVYIADGWYSEDTTWFLVESDIPSGGEQTSCTTSWPSGSGPYYFRVLQEDTAATE